MPDRFMVGTDTKTGSHYDKGINNIRSGLLSNLNQETAEKVAYKNAQRLLDLH
jgi:predicted TIM-barrel fold metal-dependent hydrolase